jgi:ATP-dependent DNA helicase DinG
VLAQSMPGFRRREGQLAMAEAVARTIRDAGQLVAEAGTGTGKTFAYLVPALMSGGKVIISTGTKTLQDQLYERDLPLVRDALKLPVTMSLLKGRANYVCLHHLEKTSREGRLPSRDDARHLQKIIRFAHASERGDRGQLADVPEHASIWPLVTSTRENCLGSNCAFFRECFVMKARKDALDADVVVVNHHLFFADIMLRDEGLSELLPACNTVILDEAHQLPDTATLFFGEQTTSGQVNDLARDAEVAARGAARDMPELPDAAADLGPAVKRLRLALGDAPGKLPRDAALARADVRAALDELVAAVDRASAGLAHVAERSEDLATLASRAEELGGRLARWRSGDSRSGGEGSGSSDGDGGGGRSDDSSGVDRSSGVDASEGFIRWVDVSPYGFQLHSSPLSVARIFRRQVDTSGRAWIFTSATLAVAGKFDLYTSTLGLTEAATGCWESPFDYAQQALLYLPRGLPAPNAPEHTDAVVDAALPVIRASGGRAFLLFTTLRALARARERLAAAFAREALAFPILVQGEGSKTELLERFRRLGNAVLLGSASFWEGVDVAGDALSVVVIDKLPFAPPDDPLLAARLRKLEDDGGNAFRDWQLPQAAISLKQGAGRLIRTETDRGVLMIGDPRLVDKPYGKILWRSLPPMRRTREQFDVEAFFRSDPKELGSE